MAVTPHDGSGTTFTFAGTAFTVTQIVANFNNNAEPLDVSHLGLTAGASILVMDRPLKGTAGDTGQQITVEYLGTALIADGTTGTLVLSSNGNTVLSRSATVLSTTLTYALNDVVRGQNVFRLARA